MHVEVFKKGTGTTAAAITNAKTTDITLLSTINTNTTTTSSTNTAATTTNNTTTTITTTTTTTTTTAAIRDTAQHGYIDELQFCLYMLYIISHERK